ncbi:hypothetical protein BDZ89DRAFT_1047634 [Hymenopellis radicata]|nr:hypothetical protein BDZ89DRAFT_1047634 [Hymenopellis radicata]
MTWFNYYSHSSKDSYNDSSSRASILMNTGACVWNDHRLAIPFFIQALGVLFSFICFPLPRLQHNSTNRHARPERAVACRLPDIIPWRKSDSGLVEVYHGYLYRYYCLGHRLATAVVPNNVTPTSRLLLFHPAMLCPSTDDIDDDDLSKRRVLSSTTRTRGVHHMNDDNNKHNALLDPFPLPSLPCGGATLVYNVTLSGGSGGGLHPGKRLLLWKADVMGAFRTIPVHPLWQLKQVVTSMVGESKTDKTAWLRYVDWRACFGSRASPRAWASVMGLVVDSDMSSEHATLPDDSKSDLIRHVHQFAHVARRRQTLHDFEQLTGWINWSLNVYPLLKPALFEHIRQNVWKGTLACTNLLNKAIVQDLAWFEEHVEACLACSSSPNLDWNPFTEANMVIFCDASLTAWVFWVPEMDLGFTCAVAAVDIRIRSNIDLRVVHVSGELNTVADALSRDYLDVAQSLVPNLYIDTFNPSTYAGGNTKMKIVQLRTPRQPRREPWSRERLLHERAIALGLAIDISTSATYDPT